MYKIYLKGIFQTKRIAFLPGGGGSSQNNLVGGGGPLPKTLTLFMTKICDFAYPIINFMT